MSTNFILPHYAPRKLPPVKRAIKDSDIPSETNKLLQLVYTIIHNRPRHFKQTPLDRPKRWWQWDDHRRPTKWSLYRPLIKHSSWLDHQLIKPASTHSNSHQPSSTPVLTNWIRSEFKRDKTLRTIPHTQEALRQAHFLLTKLVNAKSGNLDDLNDLKAHRNELMESKHRDIWGKVYKAQLAARRPPTPIMTGRFLRPSVLNGPLPRLAHQPLHISMMMSSRRKARERRLAEHRHLKEKLDTIRQEHKFESALAHDQSDVFDREHNTEVRGILDRLDVINHSFELEKERERKVYSRELLDKIEAARRRRPLVMAQRNRWKRFKTRMAELDYAVQDDPDQSSADSPEGKRFRLPEASFWEK